MVQNQNIHLKRDVLEYLQCMVNTETPTPIHIVNKMLDLIPNDVWLDDNTKILCPACKDGIFLREAVIRILRAKYNELGADEFHKNKNEILKHILGKRIFGIAVSYRGCEVTKRTLYTCEGDYFKTINNIYFNEDLGEFVKDKSGAFVEKQAFHFIRNLDEVSKFFEERGVRNMNFDVIIGNPPYQEMDGGAGSSARPLYNEFIMQAKLLKPNYISMIIPSRWFAGGKGLDKFRDEMLADTKIAFLYDYPNSIGIFPDVDIKGGVCYFLWDINYDKKCKITIYKNDGTEEISERYLNSYGVFIRYNILISILEKVKKLKEKEFSELVYSRNPFDLSTDFFKDQSKYSMPDVSTKSYTDGLEILGLLNNKRTIRYIPRDYPITKGMEAIGKFKIFVPKAYGCGAIGEQIPTPILGSPILGSPIQISTETFLMIGLFNTKKEAENVLKYLNTKFFRTLVGIKKISQNTTKDTYSFVPLQDFNEEWTDEKLYKKYGLTEEEINFIETMVKPMDNTNIKNEPVDLTNEELRFS